MDFLISLWNGFWDWIYSAVTNYWLGLKPIFNALMRAGHMLAWIGATLGLLISIMINWVSVFSNIMNYYTTALTGIHLPSAIGSNTILSNAYGFADTLVPLHEMIGMIFVLANLWMIINTARIVRGVLSLLQVAGTGVNN